MRKTVCPFAAAVVLAAACSAPQASPAAVITTVQGELTLNEADRTFITEAARSGSVAVRMGELAVDRAKSGRVQDFARRLVEERAAANEELAELALNKGIPAPIEPTVEEQHTIEQLDELAGSDFDAEYMAQQAEALEAAIILFRTQLTQTEDQDLRGFAERHLPVLEERAATAREMAEQTEDAAN